MSASRWRCWSSSTRSCANRRQAGRLATAVLLSAVVPLSVGVIRALEQWPTPDERLRSVFLHPNSYGAYLMLVLLLAIALLPTARGLVRAGLAALVLVGLGQLPAHLPRGAAGSGSSSG